MRSPNSQNQKYWRIALLAILFLLSGCIAKNKVLVTLKHPKKTIENLNVTVSNIQVINHQIIITGTNLNAVSNFNINEGANSANLQIESQSSTSIVSNTLSNVTFAAGKVFDFILSNANASSSFTVNFSLCDSNLGGKGFNCSLTPNDKEVLSYDAASGKWKPRAISGLSYQGAWDASSSLPSTTTPGDYYIVSVASGAYAIGDWIVFNGSSFDKINNSTAISNVFGRTGAISATKGDYVLTKMGDVDLTTTPPITGDVLKYDGTNWIPGTVVGGGGAVTTVSGTAPISVATGTSTPVISIAQATGTTNGYLSSADWTTFNNKQATIPTGTTAQYYRGDKSFQTLDSSVVPENTNLYFTNARTLGVPLTGFNNALTGAITATDTILQAFGRTQNQINSLTTDGSNYLIKNGSDTLSGAVSLTNVITATVTGDIVVNSVPLTMTSAVNKSYVDSEDSLKVTKAGDTISGVLTLDSDLKVKGGANYVTIRGHAASSAYNLILPSSAGTSGFVLQTDGIGNLSWINPSTTTAGTGTVTSASIVDGTIVDVDINASAAIAQSKIANLTTDLAAKQSTTLISANFLVGSAGNIATAVSMSGDATLANTGAITLKNTGTAGTYSSVTTDAQGRVTSGSSPVVVTSITGTAPITVAGTAAVPVVSMAAATTAMDGYLTSIDWNTFNNKQVALSTGPTINGIIYPANGAQTLQVPLAPVAATDAVNKQYVDLKLPLAGGNLTGPLQLNAQNEVRFADGDSSNYVSLKAPAVVAANVVWTLPAADGAANQFLTTNGAGLLSWSSPAGGVSSVNTLTGAVTLTTTNIAEGTNLYYTNARGIASTITAPTLTNSTIVTGDTIQDSLGKLQAQANAKELAITAGTSSQYLKGDKTLGTFANDIWATVLTGLSTATNSAITATDSILVAFGKLQAQISGQTTTLTTKADLTNITQTITTLAVTGLGAPVAGSDAANKTYVDGFGQWTKGASSSVNYTAGNVGIGTTAPGGVLNIKGIGQGGPGNGATFNLLRLGNASALDFGEFAGGTPWIQSNSIDGVTKLDLALNPNGGNVGIGTSAPDSTLQVNGTIHSNELWAGQLWYADTSGLVLDFTDPNFSNTGYAGRIRYYPVLTPTSNSFGSGSAFVIASEIDHQTSFTSTGLVAGLETSSYVHGNNSGTITELTGLASYYGISAGNVNTTNAYGVYIQGSHSGSGTINSAYGLYIENTSLGGGSLLNNYGIYQKQTSAKNYFGGNVGIGTTVPTEKLHLGFTAPETAMKVGTYARFGNSSGADNAIADVTANTSWSGTAWVPDNIANDGLVFRADAGGSRFSFYTAPAAATHAISEKMSILTNGNVGIGTTNPIASLMVQSNNVNTGLTVRAPASPTQNQFRAEDSTGQYRWRVDQNFNMVVTNAAGVDTFYVMNSGSVTVTSCTGCSVIAEMMPIEGAIEEGQAVCMNPDTGKLGVCAQDSSLASFGIATTHAEQILRLGCKDSTDKENSLILGGDHSSWRATKACKGWYPVALTGVHEFVKVECFRRDGTAIRYGDRLVTSGNRRGFVRPLSPDEQGGDAVLGKAMTVCHDNKKTDTIHVHIK